MLTAPDPRLRNLPQVIPAQAELPGQLRPLCPDGGSPVDAFQQIAKLGGADRHGLTIRRRPDEPPALQTLGEQTHALAVMPDQLDQVAALAPEHEQLPAEGIGLQLLLHEHRQAAKALAHGKTALIIDTKWNFLDMRARHLGISREDIYQILTYGSRFNCAEVVLLYPDVTNETGKIGYYQRYDSILAGKKVSIHVVKIPLLAPSLMAARDLLRSLLAEKTLSLMHS